jgi:hypothetical protein
VGSRGLATRCPGRRTRNAQASGRVVQPLILAPPGPALLSKPAPADEPPSWTPPRRAGQLNAGAGPGYPASYV